MKKRFVLCLVTIMTLAALSACGSKKEPTPSASAETTIEEEPVALAEEPEEESFVDEKTSKSGYTCLSEIYNASLEDGVVQIDDIIIHMGKTQTFGEFLTPFISERYIIDYSVDGRSATKEYTPTAEIKARTKVEIFISHRQGTKLLSLEGYNVLEEPTAIVDCNYRLLTIEDSAYGFMWLPGGYLATGEEITLDNLADGFFKDLTLGDTGNMEYKEVASRTGNYEYVGYVYNKEEMTYGSHWQDGSVAYFTPVYKYGLSFDKSTRQCTKLTLEREY